MRYLHIHSESHYAFPVCVVARGPSVTYSPPVPPDRVLPPGVAA
jgi:hypothetical protein